MKRILILMTMLFCLITQVSSQSIRDSIEKEYTSHIGVMEETGHNDGLMVERYLASTGLGKGNPWCAAFINYSLDKLDVSTPANLKAYTPSWFPDERCLSNIETGETTPCKGDVYGLYFRSKGRIAHVGFIDRWPPDSDYFYSIEGNTNTKGGRDGDGVYRKRRLKRQAYKVSNWTTINIRADG